MAGFCHWWKIGPAEYKALTVAEHTAMFRYMDEMNKRAEQEASKARSRGRTGRAGRVRRR